MCRGRNRKNARRKVVEPQGLTRGACILPDYFTIPAEEIGRTLHTKRTPAGHCNRLKKYLAFCYPDFSPEQEYTLRRATELGPMLRILTVL
ncbi:MAG: hypothetical protein ACI4OX_03755 [Akkermansia sp.]